MLTATQRWEDLFTHNVSDRLTGTLSTVLQTKRWFGGKARRIGKTEILETVRLPCGPSTAILLLLRVTYSDGSSDTYQLPVTAAFGFEAERLQRECPQAAIAPLALQLDGHHQEGILYDAMWNRDFAIMLLRSVGDRRRFAGLAGALVTSSTNVYADLVPETPLEDPTVMKAEQSNTSVAFSGQVILKLYRRLEEGMNPDLEIGRVLTEMRFPYIPPIAGSIEYVRNTVEPVTLALLQKFVRNDGDAWRHSLDAVDRFMVRIVSGQQRQERPPQTTLSLLELAKSEYDPLARQLIGLYLDSAARLGQRTAELHLALGQITDNAAFAPEPLTKEYRQSRYESMTRNATGTLECLRIRMGSLSPLGQAQAQRLFELRPAIDRVYETFKDLETPVPRIRCHGDYHLGQVLCTGADFMIIDFEGEPARSLAERRTKHPAMVDVAGMVRSFHYAPFAFLDGKRTGIAVVADELPQQSILWARFWSQWASAAFLKAYLGIATGTRFWPGQDRVVRLLLDVYLVEKAIYELGYELNNRPDWVEIPMNGLVDTLEKMP